MKRNTDMFVGLQSCLLCVIRRIDFLPFWETSLKYLFKIVIGKNISCYKFHECWSSSNKYSECRERTQGTQISCAFWSCFLSFCQSQGHKPMMDVGELMYVEEGKQHFSLSVFPWLMKQPEQQFKNMKWKHVLYPSLSPWCEGLTGGWELANCGEMGRIKKAVEQCMQEKKEKCSSVFHSINTNTMCFHSG